ncbi:MAG: hypothetical protein MJ139_01950 [Limosilactobacillus sp.]|nr:hypothetical protein [Limosilactobacillus sp.]
MELTVAAYLAQIENEQVKVQAQSTTLATIEQLATLNEGLTWLSDQLASGYLAQVSWQVTMPKGEDVNVRLETNLINVPMVEAARLDPKLLDKEVAYPVHVYMVIEGPEVNASGLRIDELTNAEAVMTDATATSGTLQEWVTEHLAQVQNNREAE